MDTRKTSGSVTEILRLDTPSVTPTNSFMYKDTERGQGAGSLDVKSVRGGPLRPPQKREEVPS